MFHGETPSVKSFGFASSLNEGASGEEEKLSGMPKPPSLREGDRVSGGRSNTPLSKTSKNSIIYGILKKGRNIE